MLLILEVELLSAPKWIEPAPEWVSASRCAFSLLVGVQWIFTYIQVSSETDTDTDITIEHGCRTIVKHLTLFWVSEDFLCRRYVHKLLLCNLLLFLVFKFVWMPLLRKFSVCLQDENEENKKKYKTGTSRYLGDLALVRVSRHAQDLVVVTLVCLSQKTLSTLQTLFDLEYSREVTGI